jgi:hypothetical protein
MSIWQLPDSCVTALCRPLSVTSIYCLANTCPLLKSMTYLCRQSPPPFLPKIIDHVAWFLDLADTSHLTIANFIMSKSVDDLLWHEHWIRPPACTCTRCRLNWAYNRPGPADAQPARLQDEWVDHSDTSRGSQATEWDGPAPPDSSNLWHQMMSHRGDNDWDLLAAIWSFLGHRPPNSVSRYTNQMITATAEFLGPEEIIMLESEFNPRPNLNDIPWWPAALRDQWRSDNQPPLSRSSSED